MTFEELDLEDEILDGLWDMNFRQCTPIQEQAIPLLLEGHDLIGCAQTGTGKTAAYLLPVLNDLLILHDDPELDPAIRCVIMVPTRELAQQIDQQVAGFGYYLPVSSVAIYGGNDGMVWEQQKRGIDAGADIIIATPGRLLSYIKLGLIDLTHVSHFILDEADRMLDMGFIDDIMAVIAEIPKNRKTMLFSATMPEKIRQLAQQILREPKEVRLAVSRPNDNITQGAYICYEAQKILLVQHLLKNLPDTDKVLLFASSKMKVKEVARALSRLGLRLIEMHSDLSQAERDQVMHRFKTGQNNILVATDIVSRGIDIDDITLVINFDVPHDPEDYVHRIGRTARAGEKGSALSFVSEDDQAGFAVIESFLQREVEKLPLPEGFVEGPAYDPKQFRRGKGRRRKSGGKSSDKSGAQTGTHGSRSDGKPSGSPSGEVRKGEGKPRKGKHKGDRKPVGQLPATGQPEAPIPQSAQAGDTTAGQPIEGATPSNPKKRHKKKRHGKKPDARPTSQDNTPTV